MDDLKQDYFLIYDEEVTTESGPFQPTLEELRWLQSLLETKMADTFLSESTQAKLATLLKDVPPLTKEKWIQMKQMPQPEEMAFPFLMKLKRAIREKSVCVFTYSTKAGGSFTEEGYPYELKYNIAKKRWYVEWINEKHLRKTTPLERLENVSVTESDVTKYLSVLENMDEELQTAVIQWTPRFENMDVHRFLHAFSAFRIQVIEEEPLTMEVHYFEDEESYLLSKVRQFGPHVRIESPSSLQEKMIEIAKRALENYE